MDKEALYLYETEVEWTGKQEGDLRSQNLPTLQVAPPPEFHGPEGRWTPEHLYVASVGTCFMITFLAMARISKLEIQSFSVRAQGRLEKITGRGYQMAEIVLRPRAVFRFQDDFNQATTILENAGQSCPISNSIKTAVIIEPEFFVAQEQTIPCPPIANSVSS